MKTAMYRIAILSFAAVCIVISNVSTATASGTVGIYAVIEKVVFEPNDRAPERIQLWGAFAFVDGRTTASTEPRRGFVYFQLPSNSSSSQKENILKEWADLKAVAGTGQAVAFGSWFYVGGLAAGQREPPDLVQVRVQASSESPSKPAGYSTDTGVVKLPPSGSHAVIVGQLRALLRK